jgi:2-polyprenyl-3-methyl-5-hydroxy-6-metoxy-1,4-benzoquinol methylase
MNCYLCGSQDYKNREGSVRDNKSLEILECNNCGLVFLSNTDHIIEEFYEDSNMNKELTIDKWLNESESDDSRRYEFTKNLIINKNILDFGSGAGGFLIKAKEVAKSVTAVELDNKIVEHYKKSNILHKRDIESLENSFYDVITAFHVIEHLSNPVDILKELILKLKSNGKLIIEVPNSNDALLTIYKNEAFSHFTYWSPHLFLYNDHTLRLLTKSLDIEIDFIKYIQRYPLSNHLYWLTNQKPGGHLQWGNFLDNKKLNYEYESSLASIGATDTIIMQLSKKR